MSSLHPNCTGCGKEYPPGVEWLDWYYVKKVGDSMPYSYNHNSGDPYCSECIKRVSYNSELNKGMD